ncbi:hypothetical protein FA15DRAFT_262208 [Coprinopsis marcescibilis]|uniref:Uncharacterized protein n=1 Tax=Coprinopsis marcescibilis TaxID=230819 RepID=A0A5C3KE70_COPMA|nr:hypothetical protein FA15DRAFT_262208 [Coprinopsis marcescibilis]
MPEEFYFRASQRPATVFCHSTTSGSELELSPLVVLSPCQSSNMSPHIDHIFDADTPPLSPATSSSSMESELPSRPPSSMPRSSTANHDMWLLPEDILRQIINVYLQSSPRTLKALALSCKSLAAHCRRFILQSIILKSPGPSTTASDAQRFASLLEQSPDITKFVRRLRIFTFPIQFQPAATDHDRLPLQTREEKALHRILVQKYKRLSNLELRNIDIVWTRMPQQLQLRFFSFLQRHSSRVRQLSLHLKSFPSTLFSYLHGSAECLSLCGEIVEVSPFPEYSRVQGSTTKRRRIAVIKTCHVPDSSLKLLAGECASESPIDIKRVEGLMFLSLRQFSEGYACLSQACTYLGYLDIGPVESWYGSVAIDLACLPYLEVLDITTDMNEVTVALDWLAESAQRRPLLRRKDDILQIRVCIYSKNQFYAMLSPDLSAQMHQTYWSQASRKQGRWPALRTLGITGYSRAISSSLGPSKSVPMQCLGSYQLGRHPRHGEVDLYHRH